MNRLIIGGLPLVLRVAGYSGHFGIKRQGPWGLSHMMGLYPFKEQTSGQLVFYIFPIDWYNKIKYNKCDLLIYRFTTLT